jgi:hypothetical protein
MHRPRSTPQKHCSSASDTHFRQRLSETQGLVQPEGLGKLKKFTSLGLEPATLRFVAHVTYALKQLLSLNKKIIVNKVALRRKWIYVPSIFLLYSTHEISTQVTSCYLYQLF